MIYLKFLKIIHTLFCINLSRSRGITVIKCKFASKSIYNVFLLPIIIIINWQNWACGHKGWLHLLLAWIETAALKLVHHGKQKAEQFKVLSRAMSIYTTICNNQGSKKYTLYFVLITNYALVSFKIVNSSVWLSQLINTLSRYGGHHTPWRLYSWGTTLNILTKSCNRKTREDVRSWT